MRYRALATPGRSISAVTLSLAADLAPAAVGPLVLAALEAGVNGFELVSADPRAAEAMGGALGAVSRDLAFVILRIGGGFDPRGGTRPPRDFGRHAVVGAAEQALSAGGFGRLDLVLLDAPQPDEADAESFAALDSLRASGRAAAVGVSGAGALVDAAVATRKIDVLAATYNLRSGWPQRHRLSSAAAAGMLLMGERYLPDMRGPSDPVASTGLFASLFKRRTAPTADADAYAFLQRTQGWKADEVCLAYALTEPSLSTVFVEARTPQEVARLAAVPERDLPAGVGAQIEMARFSGDELTSTRS